MAGEQIQSILVPVKEGINIWLENKYIAFLYQSKKE